MKDILQFIAQNTENTGNIVQALHNLQQQKHDHQWEVTKPPLFHRERKKIIGFINIYCLYIRIRIVGAPETKKVSWVLTYVQGGVAEV